MEKYGKIWKKGNLLKIIIHNQKKHLYSSVMCPTFAKYFLYMFR